MEKALRSHVKYRVVQQVCIADYNGDDYRFMYSHYVMKYTSHSKFSPRIPRRFPASLRIPSFDKLLDILLYSQAAGGPAYIKCTVHVNYKKVQNEKVDIVLQCSINTSISNNASKELNTSDCSFRYLFLIDKSI